MNEDAAQRVQDRASIHSHRFAMTLMSFGRNERPGRIGPTGMTNFGCSSLCNVKKYQKIFLHRDQTNLLNTWWSRGARGHKNYWKRWNSKFEIFAIEQYQYISMIFMRHPCSRKRKAINHNPPSPGTNHSGITGFNREKLLRPLIYFVGKKKHFSFH